MKIGKPIKVPEGVEYEITTELFLDRFPEFKKFQRSRIHFGLCLNRGKNNESYPEIIIWDKEYGS